MLVVTVRSPGGVAQVTEYATVAVPPEGTLTVWVLPPLTLQFPATPLSTTLWLPAASPVNLTLLLMPIGWPVPPSTATV